MNVEVPNFLLRKDHSLDMVLLPAEAGQDASPVSDLQILIMAKLKPEPVNPQSKKYDAAGSKICVSFTVRSY